MSNALPKAVGVFCGSRPGTQAVYMNTARELGIGLAQRGCTVVYGGGKAGLMGAVAEGALAAGGSVIGVIPQMLVDREVAHRGLSQLEIVPDMAVRKIRMIELSQGFVNLPGGLGTLDEMFEVLTLAQLAQHSKPSAVLNLNGYYQGLMDQASRMRRDGFLFDAAWDRLIIESTVASLLDRLLTQLEP
jgi:uncharacterized protein (TIGR00730 family)